jgi:hypothetical protein
LLTEAFSAVSGVLVGVGIVLAIGGDPRGFNAAVALSVFSLAMISIQADVAAQFRGPLAGKERIVFSLLTLTMAIAAPAIAASYFKRNENAVPQTQCQPAPDKAANPAAGSDGNQMGLDIAARRRIHCVDVTVEADDIDM